MLKRALEKKSVLPYRKVRLFGTVFDHGTVCATARAMPWARSVPKGDRARIPGI